jgi:hypothetical protein
MRPNFQAGSTELNFATLNLSPLSTPTRQTQASRQPCFTRQRFRCRLSAAWLLRLLLWTVPVAVQAQYTFTTKDDGTLTITAYTGSDVVVMIPRTIGGAEVTGIGDGAFRGKTNMDSVTIPNSVTSVGDSAFSDCAGLANVMMQSGVTNLGPGAFFRCTNLRHVALPSSVIRIESAAFSDCTALVDMVIPNSVTEVGEYAFAGCKSLEQVIFADSVTRVGMRAFRDCTALASVTIGRGMEALRLEGGPIRDISAFAGCISLTNFTVDPLNSVYSSRDGVLFSKSQDNLLVYPQGKIGSYIIPDSVTSLGVFAFSGCTSLTSVTIPDSVTNGFVYAFYSCGGLVSVTIGRGVSTCNTDLPFVGCTRLRSVLFVGKAPSEDCDQGDWFNDATNTTVYYLPGTTGWTSTFEGRPAVLWNPMIQVTDASFGVRAHGFGFNIAGTKNIPLVVEASANLATRAWVPLRTFTLTNGLVSFSDTEWTNYPARFYRVVVP